MPRFNKEHVSSQAQPAIQSAIGLLNTAANYTQVQQRYAITSFGLAVINFFWRIFIGPVDNNQHENDLLAAIKDAKAKLDRLIAVEGQFFKQADLTIDDEYVTEIYRVMSSIVIPINRGLTQTLKTSLASNTSTAHLKICHATIPMYQSLLVLLGTMNENFYPNQRRRGKVNGLINKNEFVNLLKQMSAGYQDMLFNAEILQAQLEDCYFSLGRIYETLGEFVLAEVYYSHSQTCLEEKSLSKTVTDVASKVLKSVDTYGKLAYIAVQNRDFYSARQYLDQALELLDFDYAYQGQRVKTRFHSDGVIAAFLPILEYYLAQKQFHLIPALRNKAIRRIDLYIQHCRANNIDCSKAEIALQQINGLKTQVKQRIQQQLLEGQQQYLPNAKLEFKGRDCIIVGGISRSGEQTHKATRELNVIRRGLNDLVIPDYLSYRPGKLLIFFKALGVSQAPANDKKTVAKHKTSVSTSFSGPDAGEFVSTWPTAEEKYQPSYAEPKVKTRGIPTPAEVEDAPRIPSQASLTTDDVLYSENVTLGESRYKLCRLTSRTLRFGPYAYADLDKIKLFFSRQDSQIADRVHNMLQRGKIVTKFGESGIKYCYKEDQEYRYKIKFLGNHGNVRIYGKQVGIVKEETGDVPVIEFSHCVRSAH